MEDRNAQKMLYLYIHDYLVRKNMQTTADILAEEAGMQSQSIEWWCLFWETYSYRLPNNPQAQGEQGSSSSSQTSFPVMPPNMSHDHLMALLMSQRAREQEHQRLPPRNFDANPNVFNFDELASMQPMAGSSSCHQRKANSKQQHLVSNDAISGLGGSRTIPPDPTQEVSSREYLEKIEESGNPMDEDIYDFSSSDDSSDSMDITYMQTSARKQEQQQDIPFGLVTSIQPSDNKLSCCDFSSQGKFLAAAGHEKKVFILNVTQSTSNAIPIQAHSQIIKDVRFKAISFMFATSSFDKTVKIWVATNGHEEEVRTIGWDAYGEYLVFDNARI